MLSFLLLSAISLAGTPPQQDPVNEAGAPVTGTGNCTPEESTTSVEHSFSTGDESWLEIESLTLLITGYHANCDVFLRDLTVQIDGSTVYLEDINIKRGLADPNILETRVLKTRPTNASDIEVGRIRLAPGDHTITATLEGLLDGPQDGMSLTMTGIVAFGRDWDLDDFDDDELDGGDDCDDDDFEINPDVDERWYDGIDQNCDQEDDFDQDGDGFQAKGEIDGGDDCLDTRDDTFPGAPENWYDGIDQDCGGDNDFDQDGDGFDSPDHGGDDCDDLDGSKYPGARTWDDDCVFTVRSDDSRTPPSGPGPVGTGCSRGTPALGILLLLPWLLMGRRQRGYPLG